MINLLSPELKSARRFGKYNIILVQYLVLIGVAVVAMVGLMIYGSNSLNETKTGLEALIAEDRERIAELEPIGKEAEDLSRTIDTIGTLLKQEVKFSYVLQELGSVIPNGVVLSAISLSQDTTKPIILEANLKSAELAGVFQQNLTESDLFIGADILNVSQGTVSGFGFTSQVQAYFNPDVPLNELDDAETTDTGAQVDDLELELPANTESTEPTEFIPEEDL